MKKCPYCAEEIQDAAIVCRYCGRDLNQTNPPVQTVKPAQTPGPKTAKMGLLGFLTLIICVYVFISVMTRLGRTVSSTPTAPVVTKAADNVTFATWTPTPAPLSTKTPLPSPTLSLGAIGQRVEAGGIALTILDVSKTNNIDFLNAGEGNIYLVIEVLIENISRTGETPYNPFYFSIKDSDGYQYNTTGLAPEPALHSGKLQQGDKVRGFVAFEVKSTAIGSVVTYEPLVILGGYDPIRISLESYAQ